MAGNFETKRLRKYLEFLLICRTTYCCPCWRKENKQETPRGSKILNRFLFKKYLVIVESILLMKHLSLFIFVNWFQAIAYVPCHFPPLIHTLTLYHILTKSGRLGILFFFVYLGDSESLSPLSWSNLYAFSTLGASQTCVSASEEFS